MARREAEHLAGTDSRLFAHQLTVADIERQAREPELAERVDAFVTRFGRLQDTLAEGLLPILLQLSLEPVGTVIDNLNRAERLGWIGSVSVWARSRAQRTSRTRVHLGAYRGIALSPVAHAARGSGHSHTTARARARMASRTSAASSW